MKGAVISDVHGNLPALHAVLRDAESHGVEQIVCLGDTIGYGAEPVQCVHVVQNLCGPIIRGNHETDCALDVDLGDYDEDVRGSILWTRQQLPSAMKDYLKTLSLVGEVWECDLAHASLSQPDEWDYLDFPAQAQAHFQVQQNVVSFVGHTHVPGCMIEPDNHFVSLPCQIQSLPIDDPIEVFGLNKYLVNVGSVGQPRDRDPRASYVLYDSNEMLVEYRRVEYDIEAEQKAIVAAGLPVFLAERLALGL